MSFEHSNNIVFNKCAQYEKQNVKSTKVALSVELKVGKFVRVNKDCTT